jgi:hypothetical protein
LVRVRTRQAIKGLTSLNERNTAPDNDTFLNRSASRVQCVVNAVFTFFDLHLGHATNANYSNTASQFGHTLLQFFPVVIRRGFLDLLADL